MRLLLISTATVILLAGCERARAPDLTQLKPRSDAPQTAEATNAAPVSSLLPPAEALTDTVITARIRDGLLTDPAMRGADVSVNTDHGVVSLTGLVASQEQAAVASTHAQRQDGVMRVDNHLAVNLR